MFASFIHFLLFAAPIPFYILGPTTPEFESFYTQVSLEDGGELCHNITYLGKNYFLFKIELIFSLP